MPPETPPNIVIVIMDDLGYGDLSCHGSTVHETPHLDRLAAEGLRLTDFYAGGSVCSPSRAALMTGCYPIRVGLHTGEHSWVLYPGDSMGLSTDEMTIPRLLKDAGYATMHVGKWHLGDQPPFLPTRHGFDRYFGLPYSNDMSIEHPTAAERGWPPLPLVDGETVVEIEPNQNLLTDRYDDAACSFIHEQAAADRPFFLYYGHFHLHNPIRPPMRFQHVDRNSLYAQALQQVDQSMNRLMLQLEADGVLDNTLIIYTSDHGANPAWGGSNAPLRGHKGQAWEGGPRVPCLMRWPNGIKPGSVCSQITQNMDLLPTIASIMGTNLPTDRTIDGRDISGVFQGEDDPALDNRPHYYYTRDQIAAVRQGNWKLMLEGTQLFNLRDDISETTNVAADHGNVVARLQVLADRARAELGDGDRKGAGCRPCGRVDHAVPMTPRQ